MVNEIENYLSVLKDLRDQVKKSLEGLPVQALDWRPTEGEGELATNSLTVLATHLAGSESFWIKEMVGGQPIHRNRDSEFVTKGTSSSQLRARLEAAAKDTENILPSLTSAQLDETRQHRDRRVTVRWAIVHVIEHTATHLGHIQLTRQLWMAQSGKNP